MFNNSSLRLIEEDYFANINYSKNIEYMTPTTEIMVNFSSNGLKAKKACFIYAEKLDLKGLVVRIFRYNILNMCICVLINLKAIESG